ncbi:MAG: PadR family transcriptional regulator [Acidimicrobiales bacterium]
MTDHVTEEVPEEVTTTPTSETVLAGLPRVYVRPCLLLLLAEGESHGYDLLDQVHSLGLTAVDAGGLYRALRGMERDGLLTSWWEPSHTGPARRTYQVTDLGVEALHAEMQSAVATHQLLGELLERYTIAGHWGSA